MGSLYLFTRQPALKMGYFYWLRVKNHLYTELSLGYPKDTKFCLDSKASFIDISSILHLSCFWLLGCGIIALFRTVLWLAWSPGLSQSTSSRGLFSKKKKCYTIKLFFFFKWRVRWKKGVRYFTQNRTLSKTLQISHAVLFRCLKDVRANCFCALFLRISRKRCAREFARPARGKVSRKGL